MRVDRDLPADAGPRRSSASGMHRPRPAVAKLNVHVEQRRRRRACSRCSCSCVWRSFYRALARVQPAPRTGSPGVLVIVGTDRRAVELAKLCSIHPEAGMRVRGVIGSRAEAEAAGLGDLWLGDYRDADDVLAATPAEAVVALLAATSARCCSTRCSTTSRAAVASSTSTPASPASTPGGSRRRRSPTSHCSTSRRPRCRAPTGRSSGPSTSPWRRRCCVLLPARSSPSSPLLDQARRQVARCSSASSGSAGATASSRCSSSARWSSTPRPAWPSCEPDNQRSGPAVQARRRSAGHPDRTVPAVEQPRRAAAADQRRARAR